MNAKDKFLFTLFLSPFSTCELSGQFARQMQIFPHELVTDSCGFSTQSMQNSRMIEVIFAWKYCGFLCVTKINSNRHANYTVYFNIFHHLKVIYVKFH